MEVANERVERERETYDYIRTYFLQPRQLVGGAIGIAIVDEQCDRAAENNGAECDGHQQFHEAQAPHASVSDISPAHGHTVQVCWIRQFDPSQKRPAMVSQSAWEAGTRTVPEKSLGVRSIQRTVTS